VIKTDGAGTLSFSTVGDVAGPASSTDNAVPRFAGTGGKTLQGSSVIVDDSDNVSGVGTLAAGAPTFSGVVTAPVGSGGLPSYTFTGDPNTGMFRVGADNLGFAVAGTLAVDLLHTSGTDEKLKITRTVSTLTVAAISGAGNTFLDLIGEGTGAVRLGDAQLVWPDSDGTVGQAMITDGAGALSFSTVGDVAGPASSTDNAVPRFAGTTGKTLQGSTVLIDDSDNVSGIGTLAAGAATFTGIVIAADGTTAAPGYGFAGDADTGMYLVGAASLGFAVAGENILNLTRASGTDEGLTVTRATGNVTIAAGLGTNPALTLQGGGTGRLKLGDADLIWPDADGSADEVIKTDGAGTLSFTTVGDVTGPASSTDNAVARFDGAGGKTLQASGVVIADTTHAISVGAGTAALPGLSFLGDTDTGIYRIAANQLGIASAGAEAVNIDSNGAVTYPKLPSFLAYSASNQASKTGDGTNHTVIFDTEIFDRGGDFDNTTYTFTAPVTGVYRFSATVRFDDGGGASRWDTFLVTSNRTYNLSTSGNGHSPGGGQGFVHTGSTLADMDAADTAFIRINASGSGSADEGYYGVGGTVTFFSGELVA